MKQTDVLASLETAYYCMRLHNLMLSFDLITKLHAYVQLQRELTMNSYSTEKEDYENVLIGLILRPTINEILHLHRKSVTNVIKSRQCCNTILLSILKNESLYRFTKATTVCFGTQRYEKYLSY